jgi:hypothetical protein
MADDAKNDNVKNDKASVEVRKMQQAEDGKKAMLDYEAQAAAMRARTEKLRALRLARDAAEPPAPAKKKTSPAKKPAKSAKAKPRPLSDWLDEQRKDGRGD